MDEGVPILEHIRALLEEKEKRDKARYDAQTKAVDAAFDAAKEKSQSHNDLIREMQRKESAYVTKAALYLALISLLGVITATISTLAFFLK